MVCKVSPCLQSVDHINMQAPVVLEVSSVLWVKLLLIILVASRNILALVVVSVEASAHLDLWGTMVEMMGSEEETSIEIAQLYIFFVLVLLYIS